MFKWVKIVFLACLITVSLVSSTGCSSIGGIKFSEAAFNEKQKTITGERLKQILKENEILSSAVNTFPDAKYAILTKEWVENKFARTHWQFLTTFNGIYWKYESWDCDEYSRSAHFLASVLHTQNNDKTTGIAFGEIHYLKENLVGHAANLFIYEDKLIHKYKIGFYEPQTKKIYQLTKTEKLLVFYVGF